MSPFKAQGAGNIDCAQEMPRYKCHKTVWALKIKHIEGATITPAEDGYEAFTVGMEYVEKHKPQEGGYYVVYEDGYASFSPAGVFEAGYTKQ